MKCPLSGRMVDVAGRREGPNCQDKYARGRSKLEGEFLICQCDFHHAKVWNPKLQ